MVRLALPALSLLALPAVSLALPADDLLVRFVTEHCAECHTGEEAEAGLDLLELVNGTSESEEAAETWDLVREVLQFDDMPPAGRARPTVEDKAAVLDWIDSFIGVAGDARMDPGRPVLRRLNVREYRNTVRDLCGVDFPAEEFFPKDAVGFGFDNIGATLSMSDGQFERFVDAAGEIAREAVPAATAADLEPRRYDSSVLEGPGQGGVIALTRVSSAVAHHEVYLTGRHRIRVRCFGKQAGPAVCRMEVHIDGRRVERFDVPHTGAEPGVFALEVDLEPGKHAIAARFVNDYYQPDDPDPTQRDRNLYVLWIEIEGPLDRRYESAFFTGLSERFSEHAEGDRFEPILEYLVGRAFRRPATEDELTRLLTIAHDGSLASRVQRALSVLLASPRFLFRFEAGLSPSSPAQEEGFVPGTRRLDGFELATRLAYFLWSSMPDERLFELARTGELTDESVLLAQVDRLLAADRAGELVRNFGQQWLQLRNLDDLPIESELSASMQQETLEFLATSLTEQHDLRELLGTPQPSTPLPGDGNDPLENTPDEYDNRGAIGLLGHASILTLTSNPARTSPVKRGRWVLENLLGSTPAAPPPEVGALDEASAMTPKGLREQLAEHRANESCAICHDTMDPLGFGLENFDQRGAWRLQAGGDPIDASGRLPDGRVFNGPVELARVLRDDPALVRTVVEKLFVYALGRGLERGDRGHIDAILARLDPTRPTLQQVIRAIVASSAFRRIRS